MCRAAITCAKERLDNLVLIDLLNDKPKLMNNEPEPNNIAVLCNKDEIVNYKRMQFEF
jgi:hypothetical protein